MVNGSAVIETQSIGTRLIGEEVRRMETDALLEFTKQTVENNCKVVAREKSEWFTHGLPAEHRGKAINHDLDRIYEIYSRGGTVGEIKYLPCDLIVHDIRHVLLQTILMSDIATVLALAKPNELPKDLGGNFTVDDFVTLQYQPMHHENGYLRQADSWEQNYAGASFVQTHEERGVEFAENAHKAWELGPIGVNLEKLKSYIRATKMSRQTPLHFTSFSDITTEQLTHLVDLSSYMIAPDYVPDGIAGLWWEFQGLTPEGKSLAELKAADTSQTKYIASRFMLPGTNPDDGKYRFGEGPKCLFDALAKMRNPNAMLLMWRKMYRRTVAELKLFELVLQAPKASDAFLVEASIDLNELGYLAKDYDVLKTYEGGLQEAITRQTAKTGNIFDQLPTYFVRDIFQAIAPERQKAFLTELLLLEMRDAADQNIQNVEIKITPGAWQSAAGEQLEAAKMLPVSLFIEAYTDARDQFIRTYKRQDHAPVSYRPENFGLTFVLRREDDIAINQQILHEVTQYHYASSRAHVTQFDIAGDERYRVINDNSNIIDPDYNVKLIRSIRSSNPTAKIAVNLGQASKTENYSGFPQWQAIIDSGEPVNILLYPIQLMENTDEAIEFKKSVLKSQIEVVLLPIDQAGFTLQEIADFIRDFPDKSKLRLASVHNFRGSLTMQAHRLIARENVPLAELSALGIAMPVQELKRLREEQH